jgi:hypothetical protein
LDLQFLADAANRPRQKLADPIERLRCGLQLPDRCDEIMDHAFPHVHMCIHLGIPVKLNAHSEGKSNGIPG